MHKRDSIEIAIVRDALNYREWSSKRERRIAAMEALVDTYRPQRVPAKVVLTDELRLALRRAVAAASAAGIKHGQLARRAGLDRATLVRYLYHVATAHKSRLVALVEVLKAENLPIEPSLLAA